MSDVLDNEPRSAPRWLPPLVVVGATAIAVALTVNRPPESGRPPVAASSPSQFSPAGSPLPAPGTAGNACQGDLSLPLVAPGPKPRRTGLRLLVGDRDLTLVDVDAATTRVLRAQVPPVTALMSWGNDILGVLQDRCQAQGFGRGQVVRVDPVTGATSQGQPGDALLPGSPPTILDDDPDGGSAYLRQLDSSTTRTRIQDGWLPLARRGSAYFVSVQPSQAKIVAEGVGALGTVGIGDPTTGRMIRPFGSGVDVAADASKLVWVAGGCDPGQCLLSVTGPDGIASAQGLKGRRPWSGVISPNGSRVAFRLSRTTGGLGALPGPPNDVAVLDIRTGKVRVLPGLVLPIRSGLTLTWSPDSEWLVIGADLGTRPLILIWRHDMDRPAAVPMPATGGGTTGPPALLVLPQ